jgi:hypothetical protein
MARAFGLASYGAHSSEELSLLTRFRELSRERKEVVLRLVDFFYSERADSRYEREPTRTQSIPNPVKKKGTNYAE